MACCTFDEIGEVLLNKYESAFILFESSGKQRKCLTCQSDWSNSMHINPILFGIFRIRIVDELGKCSGIFTGSVNVSVPHSQNGSAAVDSGQNFDSTQS